jgi:hypothetical protein
MVNTDTIIDIIANNLGSYTEVTKLRAKEGLEAVYFALRAKTLYSLSFSSFLNNLPCDKVKDIAALACSSRERNSIATVNEYKRLVRDRKEK